MKNLGTIAFPLTLVALLAAMTFWLERAANPQDPVRKAQKRHDPDFIVSEINIRHFGAAGEQKQSLLAATMTHYPDDDSTHITEPRLTYYKGRQNTRMSAATARFTQDNKKLFLHGDVRLVKPAFQGLPATVMQTEALTVFPEQDIAQGTARVTITRGKSVVSGDSIQYNGNTSIAVLSGRVRGTFYRAKKS